MFSKKGISSIIATLLLVALTVVLVAIVWVVVNGIVNPKIAQSSACFGNYNLVTLNSQYTCYNSSTNSVKFSLNVGNVNVTGIVVSILNNVQSESFTLTNQSQVIANLNLYDGTTSVAAPGPNSGITYIYNWPDSNAPNSIEIAPIINGQQCSSSDSISQISNCNLF